MSKATPRTPAQVFRDLPENSMNDIVKLHYQETQQQIQLSVRAIQEVALVEDVVFNGLTGFIKALPKASVAELAKVAGITEIEGISRVQLEKTLVNKIDDLTAEAFFKLVPATSLQSLVELLSLPSSDAPEALLLQWIHDKGLRTFFRQFASQELSQWCQDSGLHTHSMSKDILITALITQSDANTRQATAKEQPQQANPTKRPQLAKGISASEAFQHYSATELRAFLSDSGVLTSGKAKELAKRAVEVLEGTYTAPSSKANKKRKSADSLGTLANKAKKKKTSEGSPMPRPKKTPIEVEGGEEEIAPVPKSKPKKEQQKTGEIRKTRSVVAEEKKELLKKLSTR